MRSLLMAVLLALLCAPALADPAVDTPHEEATPEEPVVMLEGFDWLQGRWVGDHFGDWSEYIVSAPRGDSMVAMYRVVNPKGMTTIMELDQLVATPEGTFLHFKIVGPKMGAIDTPFGTEVYELAEVRDNYAKWVNPNPGEGVRWQSWTREGEKLIPHVVFRGPDGRETDVELFATLAPPEG